MIAADVLTERTDDRAASVGEGGPTPTGRERLVLQLLADGHLDEGIARRLNVSVRTCRRIIAALMDRLDARSRFQAGVIAASRGWMDGPPPGAAPVAPGAARAGGPPYRVAHWHGDGGGPERPRESWAGGNPAGPAPRGAESASGVAGRRTGLAQDAAIFPTSRVPNLEMRRGD
ncbi:helix-turn-helix transcriptional regulator [Streptomyces sp. NPDC090306]|uniref:helix-turn-helix domain-containing protein n=1 Tax=Streptomyces sp. NPDC090306 TaxID=3365961 RepID=UPI00381528D6